VYGGGRGKSSFYQNFCDDLPSNEGGKKRGKLSKPREEGRETTSSSAKGGGFLVGKERKRDKKSFIKRTC